jgi:DNA-binding MarR family transcriptional regulator
VSERSATDRPLGYWLKRVDELITSRANEALGGLGLTRLHWQTLNILREAGRTTLTLAHRSLQDFGSLADLDRVLGSLEARGWVTRISDGASAPAFELTDEGQKGHANALQLQSQVRQRTMRGVSQDEYRTVIRVLETIAFNLE